MSSTIISTILSAITATTLWEATKFFFPEIKKFFTDRKNARKIINDNIDPLLKSADELMAKIYSFAKSDFKDLELLYSANTAESRLEIVFILYLFSSFYARLLFVRKESSFINLASHKQGKQLLSFMSSFEAQKNRIVTKAVQRTIGDCMIKKENGKNDILSIMQFRELIETKNKTFLECLKPLEESLVRSKDKEFRQRIYLFGIILQCFIDHFDSKHRIIRKRDIYTNKLSKKTKNDLRFRVFNEYLPFVANPFEYYQESK